MLDENESSCVVSCYVLGWNCHNMSINEVTICHVSTFIKDKNKRWYVRRHEYILEALTLETLTLEAFKHYIQGLSLRAIWAKYSP